MSLNLHKQEFLRHTKDIARLPRPAPSADWGIYCTETAPLVVECWTKGFKKTPQSTARITLIKSLLTGVWVRNNVHCSSAVLFLSSNRECSAPGGRIPKHCFYFFFVRQTIYFCIFNDTVSLRRLTLTLPPPGLCLILLVEPTLDWVSQSSLLLSIFFAPPPTVKDILITIYFSCIE